MSTNYEKISERFSNQVVDILKSTYGESSAKLNELAAIQITTLHLEYETETFKRIKDRFAEIKILDENS